MDRRDRFVFALGVPRRSAAERFGDARSARFRYCAAGSLVAVSVGEATALALAHPFGGCHGCGASDQVDRRLGRARNRRRVFADAPIRSPAETARAEARCTEYG